MTTQEFYSWLAGAPPGQLPILADAACDGVSDPENLACGLAEGLRSCQVEGIEPVPLYRSYFLGIEDLVTEAEFDRGYLNRHNGERHSLIEKFWGWRIDARPARGEDPYANCRVGRVRREHMKGITITEASAERWVAFDDRAVAIAVLGRLSAAFAWDKGPLYVTKSFFSGAQPTKNVCYHVVRSPLNRALPGHVFSAGFVNPPAVCGRMLSWMSHWESACEHEITCERCESKLRRLLADYDRDWVRGRRALPTPG